MMQAHLLQVSCEHYKGIQHTPMMQVEAECIQVKKVMRPSATDSTETLQRELGTQSTEIRLLNVSHVL